MRIRTDFRSLIKGYQRLAFYTGNFSRYFLPGPPVQAELPLGAPLSDRR